MKKPTVIAVADVPRVFSDANVRRMVSAARLSIPTARLKHFAEAVREAVLLFLEYLGKPTGNQVHLEIAELVRAAVRAVRARKRPDYACEQVARLVEQLSAPARKIMDRRGTLPDPAALRNLATQIDACSAILGAGRLGIRHEPGRKRGMDRRSVSREAELYAPKLQERPLRQEAEHLLVMLLEDAHLRATAELPPPTAHHDRPSEFAEFLQACFEAIGLEADVIGLLARRQQRRQAKGTRQPRLRAILQRWDAAADALFMHLARRRIIDMLRRLSGPKS